MSNTTAVAAMLSKPMKKKTTKPKLCIRAEYVAIQPVQHFKTEWPADEVGSYHVKRGVAHVTLKDGTKHEVPAFDVPDLNDCQPWEHWKYGPEAICEVTENELPYDPDSLPEGDFAATVHEDDGPMRVTGISVWESEGGGDQG